MIENVIEKTNFKPLYETNYQPTETIDDKAYAKFQEYSNKIVCKFI